MHAAANLAANTLPDPATWGTWIGPSQAKTALSNAAEAYREGDHARAAAWLNHTLVVLDVNNVPADARSRELINQIHMINAERLGAGRATAQPATGDDAARHPSELRHLAVRVTAYEDSAMLDHVWLTGRGAGGVAFVRATERAQLLIALADLSDRHFGQALTDRVHAADLETIRAIAQTTGRGDPAADAAGHHRYVETGLHKAIDNATYLARLQRMRDRPGLGAGTDPGWVTATTVFTRHHLTAAAAVYDRALRDDSPLDRSYNVAALELIHHTLQRMQAQQRTTTSLRRSGASPSQGSLPAGRSESALGLLIEHYEAQRTVWWAAWRTQPVLQLRAAVEDHIAAHQLGKSQLASDLTARDWAAQRAWPMIEAWRTQVRRDGTGLDAGQLVMSQIHTLHRHASTLDGLMIRLEIDQDLPALAAGLQRAEAAGYDLTTRLPALRAQAPLPDKHTARELHYRLLADCPAAALPSAATGQPRTPPANHPARSRAPAPPVPRRQSPPSPAGRPR